MAAYESLRVFLSCPSDVMEEARIARQVIADVSATCKEAVQIELEVVSFQDFVPRTTKLPDETIQDTLNREIPKCQVFILVLWRRYGSVEPRHTMSNTEREAETAIEVLKKKKKLMFLSYFRQIPPNEDAGPQQQGVEPFRVSLRQRGIWYQPYSSPDDFKDYLTHHLYRTVLRYRLSTNKHSYLRKFWVFGSPARETSPSLAIIYPSIERTFMGHQDDVDVWLNRLEPNVVFEDFKALHKIDKTLRLIGLRDFRIYNSANTPSDLHFMNRFWLCLPRNHLGLRHADSYRDVSRFTMVRQPDRVSSYLRWRPTAPTIKRPIIVRSPLAAYLREQRSKLDISGEWHREMDHIIAKDFAILARFHDRHSEIVMKEGNLQDYFLAGIRGLGTWGAAWFIDRKYPLFQNLDEDADVQFLLEVEYRDGRIFDVRDVSDKPQRYFQQENSMAAIRRNIAAFSFP